MVTCLLIVFLSVGGWSRPLEQCCTDCTRFRIFSNKQIHQTGTLECCGSDEYVMVIKFVIVAVHAHSTLCSGIIRPDPQHILALFAAAKDEDMLCATRLRLRRKPACLWILRSSSTCNLPLQKRIQGYFWNHLRKTQGKMSSESADLKKRK